MSINIEARKILRSKYPFVKELSFHDGWLPLVSEMLTQLVDNGYDPERDEYWQIKEKFGELCVYMSIDDPTSDRAKKLYAIMRDTEKRATGVCEYCGKEGQLRVIGGWYFTACEEHADRPE